MKSLRLLALVCLFCPSLASPAAAQSRPSLSGVVFDTTSGTVGRAAVVLLTAEQSVVARGTTDDSGRFSFPRVAPGRYLLVVSFPGFADRRLAVAVGAGGEEPVGEPVRPERDLLGRVLVLEAAGARSGFQSGVSSQHALHEHRGKLVPLGPPGCRFLLLVRHLRCLLALPSYVRAS